MKASSITNKALSFALTAALTAALVPVVPTAYAIGDVSDQEQPAPVEEVAAPTPEPSENAVVSADEGATAPTADVQSPSEGDAVAAPATVASAAVDAPIVPQEAPASVTEIWVNGTGGNDSNDGTTIDTAFKTFAAALAAQKANPAITTINVLGAFSDMPSVTIPSGVTLKVAEDAAMAGTGKTTGITLSSGASLVCASGASLTMNSFSTALVISDGATLRDGSYILDNNAIAFELKGKISGTSRAALTISAKKSSGRGFSYTNTSRFERCTIDVEATNQLSEQYSGLYMTDASLTTRGVWYYFDPANGLGGLHLDKSDFTVYKATGSSNYRQVFAILGASDLVNGSTLVADGSRVTVSAPLTVTDSKLVIRNSTAGGLNVNYSPGSATFTNSVLETTNVKYVPSFGAGQSYGPCSIVFKGDSVVNTDAKDRTADNGGANRSTKSSYIVTGGSFLLAYDPSYNYDVTTPTNGPENGDEYLSLFTPVDQAATVLNPLNASGAAYTYNVAKASSDGKKHVWVPAAKVTYKLNNANASFADGSKDDKTLSTMRGYKLEDVEGNADPGAPADMDGAKFLGWFYKDASGTEHSFNYGDQMKTDLEVYAKWDVKTVVYHNGQGVGLIKAVDKASSSATVLSYEDVLTQNPAFGIAGKKFLKWTTDPAGNGEAVAPSSSVAFANGATQVDLYAQFADDEYKVAFSANGGVFSANSVFKTNPGVFDVVSDAQGGEVAVLKDAATYGQKLRDLLGGMDHNSLTPDKSAKKPGMLVADEKYWYAQPGGGGRFNFADGSFFGFPISGDNPAITSDVTYYMKWKDDPAVQKISAQLELDGDMWGSSRAESSVIQSVKAGESFSLTGAIDPTSIKEQMKAIEIQFPEGAQNPESIKLSGTSSAFKAVIKVADGVNVPADAKVSVNGLGDLFEVSSTSVNGNEVTVEFALKSGVSDYKLLKERVDSVGALAANGMITATVDGLTLADTVSNGQVLTSTGAVTGSFDSLAINSDGTAKRFSFTWLARQQANTADPRSLDPNAIQFSVMARVPFKSDLPGDIKVGSDSENASVYTVLRGETVDFTGALDVRPISTQMRAIEAQFPTAAADYSKIGVDVRSCTFAAQFVLPEGLSLPESVTAIPQDFGTAFSIIDTTVEGRKVTVKMKLNDGISNYKQLQDAVADAGKNSGGWMSVVIPGIKVADNLADGTLLTVTGTLTGEMDVRATSEAGSVKDFMFAWNATQWSEGKDVLAGQDDSIRFTCQVADPIQGDIEGDMRVNGDTEHAAVYPTEQGATLDYTGAIKTDSIKRQMNAIESQYGTDHDSILIDIKNFEFAAGIDFPEGLSVPDDLDASKVVPGSLGGFSVKKVEVLGQRVVVTFAIADPSAIRTYTDLEKLVDGAGDPDGWMSITVPGVKVSTAVPSKTQLTAKGWVAGSFSAIAQSVSGTRKVFSFEWAAVQWPEGKDAVAVDDGIQLTVQVTGKTMTIPLAVTWDDQDDADQIRPKQVTVRLIANGKDSGKSVTVTSDKGWQSAFENLPVYDESGNAISYDSVIEDAVEGYVSVVSGNAQDGFMVKNIHIPGKVDPPVDPIDPEKPIEPAKPHQDVAKVIVPPATKSVLPVTSDSLPLFAVGFGLAVAALFAAFANRRKGDGRK